MEFKTNETFKTEDDAITSYPFHEKVDPEKVQTLRSAPFTKCECGETQVMVLRPEREEHPNPIDDNELIVVAICEGCGIE